VTDLDNAQATVRVADATPTIAQCGDYNSSNKTMQVRVLQGSVASVSALKTVPLGIARAREIASNNIQNLAAHGGILASDSVPDLLRVNGATDKALRLTWAAGEQDEIQFEQFTKPADLDVSSDLTVHLMVAKDANTDTAAVIDVQAWDGVGDTEMGGNTAALATADLTEYTVTIANANIAAAPGFMNFGIIPGAHANDAIYLYDAWIEYASSETAMTFSLTDLAADADAVVNLECTFRDTSVDA
jgi:hypothetical protein